MKHSYNRPGDWIFECATRVWAVFREGTTRETHMLVVQYACCGILRVVTQKNLYNKKRAGRVICSACRTDRVKIRARMQEQAAEARARKHAACEQYNVVQPLWEKPPSATGGIWEDSRG